MVSESRFTSKNKGRYSVALLQHLLIFFVIIINQKHTYQINISL